MVSCKAMRKILYGNSEKVFSKAKLKMALRNIFQHFFRANFFMFVVIIRFCSFIKKIFCTFEFFKKLILDSSKRLVQFQLFKKKLTRAN